MGEVRDLCPVTACEICERLRDRVKRLEELIAKFHARSRTVWGEETPYSQTDLYEEARKVLSE